MTRQARPEAFSRCEELPLRSRRKFYSKPRSYASGCAQAVIRVLHVTARETSERIVYVSRRDTKGHMAKPKVLFAACMFALTLVGLAQYLTRSYMRGCTPCLSLAPVYDQSQITVQSGVTGPHMNVAVLVYGLPRSLSLTYKTIQEGILKVLIEHHITYEIFMHHVRFQGFFSNSRNEEHNITLNNSEWRLLRPDVALSDDHDAFLLENTEVIHDVLKYGDAWENDGQSFSNEFEALHSLKCATVAADRSSSRFDGMIILRPDLHYLDPIDGSLLRKAIAKGFLVTPSWQTNTGMNDRFAFGSWAPMYAIGTRYDLVLKYCQTENVPWHAERFLKWTFDKHVREAKSGGAKVKNCHTTQRAVRVRANGNFREERFGPDLNNFRPCK